MKNYYQILGVTEDAEPVVIRAAFKVLAKKYHPDSDTGYPEDGIEKMRLLNRAFEILNDPVRREIYDRLRKHGQGMKSEDIGKTPKFDNDRRQNQEDYQSEKNLTHPQVGMVNYSIDEEKSTNKFLHVVFFVGMLIVIGFVILGIVRPHNDLTSADLKTPAQNSIQGSETENKMSKTNRQVCKIYWDGWNFVLGEPSGSGYSKYKLESPDIGRVDMELPSDVDLALTADLANGGDVDPHSGNFGEFLKKTYPQFKELCGY